MSTDSRSGTLKSTSTTHKLHDPKQAKGIQQPSVSSWGFYYWLPLGVTATAGEKRSSLRLFPLSPGTDVDWNLCSPCVVDSRMRSSSSLGDSEAWSDLEESNSSKGVSHMFAWGRLFLIGQLGVGVGVRKGAWAASVRLCTSFPKILWPGSFWWGNEVSSCPTSPSSVVWHPWDGIGWYEAKRKSECWGSGSKL